MKSEWDKLVTNYSKRVISPFYSQESRNEFLKLIPEKVNPIKTLDVGCGKGYFNKLLSETCIGQNKFSGIDISFDMIKSAKENVELELELCQSSAGNLPFQDSSFTLVAAINSIIMDNPFVRDNAFKEIKRVLASEGDFIALFPSNENHNEQLYYLKKGFENEGFEEGDAISMVYEDLNDRLYDPIGGYVNIANEDIRIKLYSKYEILDLLSSHGFENISVKHYLYPDKLVDDLGFVAGRNGIYDWFVSASKV